MTMDIQVVVRLLFNSFSSFVICSNPKLCGIVCWIGSGRGLMCCLCLAASHFVVDILSKIAKGVLGMNLLSFNEYSVL